MFSHSVLSDSLRLHVDCSPPGSSVYEISLERILEWVAISYSSAKWKCWILIFKNFQEAKSRVLLSTGTYCTVISHGKLVLFATILGSGWWPKLMPVSSPSVIFLIHIINKSSLLSLQYSTFDQFSTDNVTTHTQELWQTGPASYVT